MPIIHLAAWGSNEEISCCLGPVLSHSQVMCLDLFSGMMCLKFLMLTSPKWDVLTPETSTSCSWLQGTSLEDAGL